MFFTSITDYLEHIFNEFQCEISSRETLCDLNKVSFKSGDLPDYNNRAQALLYCLRYHFGYSFEYEYIYNRYVLNNFDDEVINVLSIGCGNGIDLWSLDHAIRRSGSQIKQINYLGIDRIDWREYFCERDDNVTYHQCDVQDLPERINDVDVLIFPKSISEMKNIDLEYLSDIISNSSDDLFVVASFRAEDNNLGEDVEKFDRFITLLEGDGFNITMGEPNIYHCFNETNGIISYYSDYKYPDAVLDYLTANLFMNCSGIDEDDPGCMQICRGKLSRNPILTTSQIRFNIVRIQR